MDAGWDDLFTASPHSLLNDCPRETKSSIGITSNESCPRKRYGILFRRLKQHGSPEIYRQKVVNPINLKYTIKYSAVHSFYWSVFCSSLGFAAVFLLSKHFSNSEIGIVLAIANIFAVLLQPAAAAFADTTQKISMKDLTVIFAAAAGALAAVRCFTAVSFAVLAVLFILELTILLTLQPLVNSLGMQLINKGIGINFGFSRGIGSVTYAAFSILLGILVERFGTDSLPAVSAGLYILLGIAIYTLTGNPTAPDKSSTLSSEDAESSRETKPASTDNPVSFLAQNKKFTALMAAISLTFCSHSMISNYLIQITENLGGTAKDMGIATGIAAVIELPAMILFGFLVKKIRCSSILKFSLFSFMLKTLITVLATNVWMLYIAQLFQFGSYALFVPASVYYVNETIPRENLAKGQAFMTSATTLGGVTASLFGGLLLDGPGVSGMLLVGLIASALGFAIALYAAEKEHTSDKPSAS